MAGCSHVQGAHTATCDPRLFRSLTAPPPPYPHLPLPPQWADDDYIEPQPLRPWEPDVEGEW